MKRGSTHSTPTQREHLVVHYHPVGDSFSAALFDRIVSTKASETARLQLRTRQVGAGEQLTADVLRDATNLTFVYPTWWGSLPAALLAELVRVLEPWVDGVRPRATNPLADVEHLRIITTHGSPKHINALQGEPGKRLWHRVILPLCAPTARFEWNALYGLDRIDRSARQRFLDSL